MTQFVYSRIDAAVNLELKQGLPSLETPGRVCAHYHNACEICLFRHSHVQAFMQNEWYDVQDGDVVIVPAYEMHRYVYSDDPHYTRLLITVSKAYLTYLFGSLQDDTLQKLLNLEQCTHLKPGQEGFRKVWQSAADALNAFQHWKHDRGQMHETLFRTRFFIFLYELSQLMKLKAEMPMRSSGLDWTRQAICYIDRHYARPLPLEEIADAVHVDKYYLCHGFKKQTGISVVGYIHHRRIIEAEKKMLYTNVALDVIASECGFNSIQHFYRVFKSVTGKTPGEYREERNRSSRSHDKVD